MSPSKEVSCRTAARIASSVTLLTPPAGRPCAMTWSGFGFGFGLGFGFGSEVSGQWEGLG